MLCRGFFNCDVVAFWRGPKHMHGFLRFTPPYFNASSCSFQIRALARTRADVQQIIWVVAGDRPRWRLLYSPCAITLSPYLIKLFLYTSSNILQSVEPPTHSSISALSFTIGVLPWT